MCHFKRRALGVELHLLSPVLTIRQPRYEYILAAFCISARTFIPPYPSIAGIQSTAFKEAPDPRLLRDHDPTVVRALYARIGTVVLLHQTTVGTLVGVGHCGVGNADSNGKKGSQGKEEGFHSVAVGLMEF